VSKYPRFLFFGVSYSRLSIDGREIHWFFIPSEGAWRPML
jgi:hypothetical protein